MILNSIRTAHCCILELLIFHPQLFSQRSAFTRSAPQISGIALHATTSLYIFSQHTHSGSRFHCHFPYITSAAVPRRRHFLQPFGLTSPLFFICSIHNGHHLVPHPQYLLSALSHHHGTILQQRHLSLLFCLIHHHRRSCLTFRPLRRNHQLLRGHITCQHILHRRQPL